MGGEESGVRVSGAGPMHTAIRRLGGEVLRREKRRGQVSIVFLGKTRMQQLNARFLKHNFPTDVISFSSPSAGNALAAEIYICRYVAAHNARAHGVPVREELLRLVTHGLLHALGWDHPSGAGRIRSPMWRRQERYVASLT